MKKLLLLFATVLLINFSARAATYTVDNNGDGAGQTLRWAITQANSNVGADLINFNLGVGPATISITSALPALTDNATTIDGFDNGGFPGTPNTVPVFNASPSSPMNAVYKVTITNAVASINPLLVVNSSNNAIRGLILNHSGTRDVSDTNLQINGNSNSVEGCIIQMIFNNMPFSDIAANYGIYVTGANNIIGSGLAAGANVFFVGMGENSSPGAAIAIGGATAAGNHIRGNMIGLHVDGFSARANMTVSGIELLTSASNNVIGGTISGYGNVISGTYGTGLNILVASVSNTLIQGNHIGTSADGMDLVDGFSAQICGIHNDGISAVVGGNTPAARNIISGNGSLSVGVEGKNMIIQGNYIGTNRMGYAMPAATQTYGIYSQGNCTIGGTGSGEGNLISGNASVGILTTQSNNIIQGNVIGPDVTGIAKVALVNYQGTGIRITGTSNLVGGATAEAKNIISANKQSGIQIQGGSNNTIQGNYIGPGQTGAAIPANAQIYGIYIFSSGNNNKIGGWVSGESNTIAYNNTYGVHITGATSSSNIISRNPIYGLTLTKAINLNGSGNDNYVMPTITSVTTTLVSGTALNNGDIVEVFKTDGSCINALQYLGSATVAANAWSVAVALTASDVVIANVRNTVSNNTSEFTPCTVLPIELLSFKGKNQGATNLLKWTTATEINNDYFTIEAAPSGSPPSTGSGQAGGEMRFVPIGVVRGAGNSTTELNYSFEDSNFYILSSNFCYYRLKQTDFNGDYTYSNTISLINTELSTFNFQLSTLFPNPASDDLNYAISSSGDTEATLRVTDVLGRTVIEENIVVAQGLNTNKMDVSEISRGSYILQAITKQGNKLQKQFSVK